MAKVKKVKDKQRAKRKAKKKALEDANKIKERYEGDVLYICTERGEKEIIPEEVVMHFDLIDDGDISEPPRFTCEKCGGIMKPERYERVHNVTYTFEE